MQSRALAAVRLSVKKDESTSPERQKSIIRLKADALGAELVGLAEDLNVSASKTGPFERPKLGEWLRLRSNEYDTIIFWRLDRAVRSMRDLNDLTSWARDQRKRIVFCEGPAATYSFDFRESEKKKAGGIEELLVQIIAWAAQMESEATSERVTSSHKYLRQNGEWGGGVVPYGFMPEAKPKRGFRLVHNPLTMPILKEIIRLVLDGEHLLPICRDLNKRGVPTPRDAWEVHKGREPKGRKWNTPGMKRILQSRALLGEWWYDGERVKDDNGGPVERAKPVVTLAEFNRVQDSLLELSMAPKQRYEDPNPVLNVALCSRCGEPYYMKQEMQKGRVYKSLSCRSRHGDQLKSCGQPTVALGYAEAIVSEVVLGSVGDLEVQRREFIPGDDRSEEKAQLEQLFEELEDEQDRGLIRDRNRYLERKRKMLDQLEEIGTEVVREAGYRWHGTGQTYHEIWADLDVNARLKLMSDLGLKIYLGRGEAPAAEIAWELQTLEIPELPNNIHISRFYDVEDVNRALSAVQEGSRVRKDFQVWALQSAEGFPHQVITRTAELVAAS